MGQRQKTLVGAFGTFDSGLFANSLDPFIAAHWRIAGPARLEAFEAARVNIFAPTKHRREEGDFGLGGGTLIHATLRQVRKPDRWVHNPILYLHLRLVIESRQNGILESRKEDVADQFRRELAAAPVAQEHLIYSGQ